ncbi:hypothetical protein THMA_0652 [Thermotoga maritima MSB8]|jgi:hypothetical protein|uniref:DUF2922 domain-containing protein n=1 Tax=Thermotoga maritima (strain ATCC 43589 / DSM 3109 / JCM 10099 / NBRC 100826 / MSB8) TaxID=243274 RepID=Q9WZA4_THEMA|nr:MULTISPECIES: DUF2922 domain-containing protein [Thermotoga]AAD35720.1 hypothetical protein TM_0636 [Thermotoga maritima MSB8]AGL49562.1 hypothetical protein Tmari_0637 [Thermotoga maritima MSB8]AHD17609.1 hypothetical protein THEMA_01480 [Thermotoga maritima MSB8]AJG40155.1 hypothetical protein TRQ7_01530 [Thermotoga sp. RQ7]AKE26559.1 hypothetical protein THMC_0652 [Thermotoga maritima]
MKRLYMDFYNEAEGKRRRIIVNSPADGLTADQVQTAMQTLLDSKVLEGYAIDRAVIVETNSNEFFDLIH